MNLKSFRSEYNSYYDTYLELLNQNDNVFKRLETNCDVVNSFFKEIKEIEMKFSYSKGKWTISQILQHIIDTERIFCYRALKITREKRPEIIAYNHETYANNYNCHFKDLLLEDYNNNRKSSISLFKTLSSKDLNNSIDQEHYKFKVGLIPFIFCGHELHHLNIIKSKYLVT
jgi:hypothetical protein